MRALEGTAVLVYWQGWRDALRRRGGPPWLGGWGWMTGREEGVTYLRSACERVAAMRVIAPSNFWERSRRRTRDELGRLPSFTTTLPSTPTRRPSVAVGRVAACRHRPPPPPGDTYSYRRSVLSTEYTRAGRGSRISACWFCLFSFNLGQP